MTQALHVVCPACGGVNRLPAQRLHDAPKCGKCQSPLFQGQPLPVDQAAFQRHVERSDLPLLVDFWAEWCGPCRMMAPAFAEAARTLEPRMRLLKVNTEQEQGLAMRYSIRSIPSLLVFHQGREIERMAGALGASDLVAWARRFL